MSRPYAPKSVLRHLPFDLLRTFLDHERIDLGVDWDGLPDGESAAVSAVYTAWTEAGPEPRRRVELMLRRVHDLATPFGTRALIGECQFRGDDPTAELDAVDGHHGKALWVLMNHPPAFHAAHLFETANSFPGRYWATRTGLPVGPADLSPDRVQELKRAIADYYRREEGRGHRCTLEAYPRPDGLHLFAYLDDYTETYVGHDDRGSLRRSPQRPAFEVVFVHDPVTGMLDLYARGGKPVKRVMTDLFCRHLLGVDAPEDVPDGPAYDLSGLLDPHRPFPTDPADGVTDVIVRRLRVGVPFTQRRVTLESDPRAGPKDIHVMVADHFPPARFPRDRLTVTQATLCLVLAPADGGKDRALTFDMSCPDRCTLKNRPDDDRALGEKYLSRWGLNRDRSADLAAQPGRVA